MRSRRTSTKRRRFCRRRLSSKAVAETAQTPPKEHTDHVILEQAAKTRKTRQDQSQAASGCAQYWELTQGIDPDVSYERMEQPDFLEDFNAAFDIAEEEMAKLLAEEDDDD